MPDLVLDGIGKAFGDVVAVEQTSLTLRHGELTALLGPSGCGKTTLLRMIAGLESPSQGRILLGDRDVTALPAHQRKFGMVFQSFALFPHLTVAENVAYSLSITGVAKGARAARAAELLDLVRLGGFGSRRIGELSGGQRQRVAIARALAQEPDVFLLDEPMSALDAKLREDMQVELRLLQQRLGITTVVVTHDQREAMTMADSIVVMSNGRAEQVGPPQQIYHKPRNAFVASFIGRANFLHGRTEAGGIRIGETLLAADPPARFIDGSAVVVGIRPERTCIDDDTCGNIVPAEITFTRDLGPVQDIHLSTPLGPMVAEYAAGENLRKLSVGDRVDVGLPTEALHIFPDESGARAA